jgi:hypothetical protein
MQKTKGFLSRVFFSCLSSIIFLPNMSTRKRSTICFLALIFITSSFLIACFPQDKQEQSNADAFFPQSINIGKAGQHIKISHTQSFLPNDQSNFLFFFWVNLRELPKDGERLVLASKYTGQPPNIVGYAVGLRRDGSTIRPVVFWGDGTKAGRWYDFPELTVSNSEWQFFALHVHKGEFFGLYSAAILAKQLQPLKYLGSHQVEIKAGGQADIILGAPTGRNFRGRFGPVGIVNPFKFKVEETETILKEYLKDVSSFDVFGDEENLKLYLAGQLNNLGKELVTVELLK